MKVTTKKGDLGLTSLIGKQQVDKTSLVIQLLGEIDELQAILGLVKVELVEQKLTPVLTKVQKQLYLLMTDLSGGKKINTSTLKLWLAEIETAEKQLLEKTTINNQFIIPGNSRKECLLNWVRTKTRSVERTLCLYAQKQKRFKQLIPFFNRLSDYFFILSQN